MTIAYVYKWTHIPTMKWYVGSRFAKGCHPDDGYICSSKIKTYIVETMHNWKREIIETGTPEDMYELESEILQLFDAKNDSRSFNKHNNDGFKHNERMINFFKKGHEPWNKGITGKDSHAYGFKHTEEIKKILSIKKMGKNNPNYGKKPWNKGIKTGLHWYNNGKVIKQYYEDLVPKGFTLGRKIAS